MKHKRLPVMRKLCDPPEFIELFEKKKWMVTQVLQSVSRNSISTRCTLISAGMMIILKFSHRKTLVSNEAGSASSPRGNAHRTALGGGGENVQIGWLIVPLLLAE